MSKLSAEAKRLARKRHKAEIRVAQYRASTLRKAAKGESKSKAPAKHSTRKEYSHRILDAKAQRRFEEAQERQAAYNKLTLKQKLTRCEEREQEDKGNSTRETLRLQALIGKQPEKKPLTKTK